MQTIKRDIYVTKNVLQAPIEVTEGTNSIAIEFDVGDYDIPASAAAVVYSMCTSTMAEPNKALAEVDGNTITIIPSESFFHAGQNVMQIRVIDGDSKLISFNIIVKCTGKMRFGDEEEEKQTTLVEQLLKRFGNYEAELKDVRKGFAGESYDTAGEAVRKQIESVNQKVDQIETISTKEIFHRSCHECNWSEYQYCEISENRSQAFASWIQLLDRYYLYEFADATRIRSVVKLRIILIGGSGFRSFYFCILANRCAIAIRKHPTNTKHHWIPIFVKNADADSVSISTRFTPILSTDSVAARWLPHSVSSTN